MSTVAYRSPLDDPGDPDTYPSLLSLDGEAEDALIDCICAATGIPPDDLDGDDWPLGRLVARLKEDYAMFAALRQDAYHLARALPVTRVWTPQERALAATSAAITDTRGDPE